MIILKTEKMLCPCCMEEHDVHWVRKQETNIFKGMPVGYSAEYCYCDRAEELFADENQISSNDIALKNAFREKAGLLTSYQIAAIRARYGISQSDLCLLLGWGAKTITRYESHQIQDVAHDTILKKLDSDPEWFLQLLDAGKSSLSSASYAKYNEAGTILFEKDHDLYLKSAIMSKYARYMNNSEATGGKLLSLEVVADMIHYYANSQLVTKLFPGKLMRMLWYADALSYKRHGQAISGLVYFARPVGAVPVAYESIVDLSTINREEIEMDDGIGYKFLPTEIKEYPHLTFEDKGILDAIIQHFGKASNSKINQAMHLEEAYTETALYDIIKFRYTRTLRL